jgi:hypothetical protein
MFDKRISKYLAKIKSGQAIKFATFLSILPESLREDVRNNASVQLQQKGLSFVKISCEVLNERLYQLTIEPENRVEATTQGDSHKVNTSTSYLLAYHEKITSIHPETVVINSDGANCKFKQKTHVIIVENLELFFAREVLLDKMNLVFGLNLSFINTDLIYGSGNQVTNKLNKEFLSQYESTLCFFDYDLGGLKIFKALRNMLGAKAKFLEPTSENLRKYFIKKPEKESLYFKALASAEELGLMALHSLLLSETAFMEQEVILAFE